MSRESPFGKASRVRGLKLHLAEFGDLSEESAWRFVYEELLWIDGSTGLAHLYESDKAQPGRPWYERTVLFTDLLCEKFGNLSRDQLKERIDRLFRFCLEQAIKQQNQLLGIGDDNLDNVISSLELDPVAEVMKPAEGYIPDVSLITEFTALIMQQTSLSQTESESLAQNLVSRARHYFTIERKRQNVLGEGFEDLLETLIHRISHISPKSIVVRRRANELPGFLQSTIMRDRIEAPDIAFVRDDRTELLASVKWSLRHDRQKQLSDELDCYVSLLSQDRFPSYILITNEFDPGRLINTNGLRTRGQAIDRIYHINLDILLQVLQTHHRSSDLLPLIESGRLRSLREFFVDLRQEFRLFNTA